MPFRLRHTIHHLLKALLFAAPFALVRNPSGHVPSLLHLNHFQCLEKNVARRLVTRLQPLKEPIEQGV